ncbi:MAG: putative ABC transporter permease [Lachnospiraceae bacterium]
MLIEQSVYLYLWFFMIYAFIGWCTEVIYATMKHGSFVNRGFLNGPLCPIYGFGVCLIVYILTPLKQHSILLFFASMLLTSLLEYITGFILEKIFHEKWWDYSEVPFNISGYICPAFSILWGLACVFILHLVHPTILHMVECLLCNQFGSIFLLILYLLLLADIIVTIATIKQLQHSMHLTHKIAEELHMVSDAIGQNLCTGVLKTIEATEDATESINETKLKFKKRKEELLQQMQELKGKQKLPQKRLLLAFPRLKKHIFHEHEEE